MKLIKIVLILIVCSVFISLLTPTGYIVLKPFKNERCMMGYTCSNETTQSYKFGNCKSYPVMNCFYGCKEGKCLEKSASAGI